VWNWLVGKFYQKVGVREQGRFCSEPVPHLNPFSRSGGARLAATGTML